MQAAAKVTVCSSVTNSFTKYTGYNAGWRIRQPALLFFSVSVCRKKSRRKIYSSELFRDLAKCVQGRFYGSQFTGKIRAVLHLSAYFRAEHGEVVPQVIEGTRRNCTHLYTAGNLSYAR